MISSSVIPVIPHLTLYFGSLGDVEVVPMLNHCNVDHVHNDRLYKMVP